MVWYSHLFQNFPQYIAIHTVSLEMLIKGEGHDLNLPRSRALFTVFSWSPSVTDSPLQQLLLSLAEDGIYGEGLGHLGGSLSLSEYLLRTGCTCY